MNLGNIEIENNDSRLTPEQKIKEKIKKLILENVIGLDSIDYLNLYAPPYPDLSMLPEVAIMCYNKEMNYETESKTESKIYSKIKHPKISSVDEFIQHKYILTNDTVRKYSGVDFYEGGFNIKAYADFIGEINLSDTDIELRKKLEKRYEASTRGIVFAPVTRSNQPLYTDLEQPTTTFKETWWQKTKKKYFC